MFNLFCDSRKTEFRDAEATGTVKANLNKTSRSEKTWSIVLFIVHFQRGIGVLEHVLGCECSSSMFTFISDWYFSDFSSEKRLGQCGLKAQSAFSSASLYVKRCFTSPVIVSIISKHLNLNCAHISRLLEISRFRPCPVPDMTTDDARVDAERTAIS